MAQGDVYELTLKQIQLGQNCFNTFFYLQELAFVTTEPTVSQVLAQNWRTQKLQRIKNLQPAEVLTTEIKVRNLFNESDGFTLALSEAGAFTTDRQMLPSFSAYGFTLNGDNPAVKAGAKRFAGVFEDYVDDGVVSGGSLVTPLNAVGDMLEEFVTVGTIIQDDVFRPVVVQRVREGSPGAYEYRLPATSVEAVTSRIIVAVWNAVITSQLSRKVGVGV